MSTTTAAESIFCIISRRDVRWNCGSNADTVLDDEVHHADLAGSTGMSELSHKQTVAVALARNSASESGIDVSLLKERLKLTVTERWERNCQAVEVLKAFWQAGRARRAETAAPADRTTR